MGSYEFEAEIWLSESVGAWAFVTVPPDLSEDIRYSSGPPAGFGSVRVEVTVGGTTWRTSVFPDARSGCFVLPFKQAVRRAESLDIGDVAQLSLSLINS